MKGRGFTLLEVVIALSLVLALGALVMPAVSRRLGGARGDAAMRELRAAIAEARTDAIRESRPMKIEFVSASDAGVRVVASVFETQGASASVPTRFVGPVLDEPSAPDPRGSGGDRLLLVMGRGSSVSRVAPTFTPGDIEGDAVERPENGDVEALGSGAELPGSEARVCLGIMLPTGGAVPGAAVYVTLAGSSTLEVVLDGWTGAARVTRWEPPAPEDEWGADVPGDLERGR